MKYKKLLSILCVSSLLISQASMIAYSINDNRNVSLSGYENNVNLVSINGFDITETDDISNYLKTNISIKPKNYNNDYDVQVDYTKIKLTGIKYNDEVYLTAKSLLNDKNAGNNKTVTLSDFKLTGRDCDRYELNLPTGFQVDINNVKIIPKEITVAPVKNTYSIKEINDIVNRNLDVEYTYNTSDIINGDSLQNTAKLKIRKNGMNSYIYALNNENAGNYKFVIDSSVSPMVNKPSVKETFVELQDSSQTDAVLKQNNDTIYANRSIRIIVKAEALQSFDNGMVFSLFDSNDSQIVNSFTTTEYEKIGDLYIYTGTFDLELNKQNNKTLENIKCKLNNNSEGEVLDLKIDNNHPSVKKLLLDNTKPAIKQIAEYNEDGTVKKDANGKVIYKKALDVTYNVNANGNYHNLKVNGTVYDNLSGIEKIEYQWDNDDDGSYTKLNDFSVGEGRNINFNFVVSYDNLPKLSDEEKGVHTLYLKITDKAGNVFTDNGKYCAENDGMDTKHPEIKNVSLTNETDSTPIDKVLKILSFGLYTKKTLKLKFNVNDISESEKRSDTVKVYLMNGNDVITEETKKTDSSFEFKLGENEEVVNDLKIKVSDGYGNSDEIPLKKLLEDKKTNNMEWKNAQKNMWVFDKTPPTLTVNYNDDHYNQTMHYYNAEDIEQNKKIDVFISDDQALGKMTVKKDNDIIEENTYEDSVVTSTDYEINTQDFDRSGLYTYIFSVCDMAGNGITKNNVVTFFIDKNIPRGDLSVTSPDVKQIDNKNWIREKDISDDKIKLLLKISNNASDINKVVFNINGEKITVNGEDSRIKKENGVTYVALDIDTNDYRTDSDNAYNISAEFTTVSGNQGTTDYTLYVDKADPTVSNFKIKKTNSGLENIINILTFGIFFNDKLEISTDVTDAQNDVGIDYVVFEYNDENGEPKSVKVNKQDNSDTFSITLPENTEIFNSAVKVTAYDKLTNTTESDLNKDNLVIDSDEGDAKKSLEKNLVMVEYTPPEIEIKKLPENDYYDGNVIWYKEGNYNKSDDTKNRNIVIGIKDTQSGIRSVYATLNGTRLSEDNKTELLNSKITESNNNAVTDEQLYYFSVDKLAEIAKSIDPGKIDGQYTLLIKAVDNAGNMSKPTEIIFNRDVTKPEITGFNFNVTSENGKDKTEEMNNSIDENDNIIKMDYGYYFKDSFEVNVVAKDENVSSGLNKAVISLVQYDENGDLTAREDHTVSIENKTGLSEALKIPKGFKGMILAKVSDNTGNISDEKTPRAFVSDVDKPDISIEGLPETNLKDDCDNKLYKDNVSFTVTVTDNDSGLKEVSYQESSYLDNSKADKEKPVITNINDEGNYSLNEDIGDGWIVTKMDMNVVTQVQKKFSYGQNGDDKNIYASFKAFDNSNNDSFGETEKFTIDRVAPEITSVEYVPSSVDNIGKVTDFIDKLEYGYYFKEPFTIVANCQDEEPSSGLTKVDFTFVTYKDGKKISQKTESADITNGIASYTVPAGFKGQIFVTPYDSAENSPKEITTQAFVVEKNAPEITIDELPLTNITDNVGNKLYSGKVKFNVTITDTESGLRNISYSKSSTLDSFNDKKTSIDNTGYKVGDVLENGWKINKMDNNLVTQVSQTFMFDKDDKNIYMTFNSTDRSKNKSAPKSSKKFTIDTVSPTIQKFNFEPSSSDNISEVSKFIEELEYGYYFKKEFNAVVTVDDKEPSSGLDRIVYHLVSYDNNGKPVSEEQHTVAVTDKKASYTVPVGFKGQIYVQVYDRAANKSDEETPQAFVVDETAPTITVEPLPDNKSKTDMDGNKLYTETVKFRVTITDNKSGLREIVYSKKSEKDSYDNVVTKIDNTLGYDENTSIGNGWQVTKKDKNLITEVSQVFTFTSDDNNIVLSFNATDRSKNTSKVTKNESFTIDKTAPVVQIDYPKPVNGKYYKGTVSFNIKVTERNFDAALMIKEIKDTYKGNNPTISYATNPSNPSVHTATVVFTNGDYTFSYNGEDRGANKAQIYDNGNTESATYFYKTFNVDDETPIVKTNFNEFVIDGKDEYYFNKNKTVNIEVTEHNFYAYDMGVSVEKKASGSGHSADGNGWYQVGGYLSEWKDDTSNPDKHILSINLKEDAIYRVTVSPVDRAGNKANTEKSVVFEIDKTPPKLYNRNNINADDNGFVVSPYYEVYDEKKKDDPAPSVHFEDLNFDRVEIKAIVYKPKYIHKNEIINIEKDKVSNELTQTLHKKDFNLDNYFNDDGVYILTYVAYDKAGNSCAEINDTYFRMVNTDVLAYISNSNITDHTGYYSLMDEEGKAISKKASDFKDLDINIITKKGDKDSGTVVVRDEKQQYSTSEYVTSDDEKISDTAIIRKTHLKGSYFSETFKDDSLDARMYLSVMYKNTPYDLAAIHIDNEKPTATLPDDFVSWHNYMFTHEVTIKLTDISESLNKDLCKVYECPREGERTEIPFVYDKEANTLSFKLEDGLHNIDITLTDEAGNEWNIDRVRYLRVGNFRLYLGIGIGVAVIGVIVIVVLLKKRKRNKKSQEQQKQEQE